MLLQILSSLGPFQKACLNLTAGDQTINPLGSNNELEEDDKQAVDAGIRAKHLVNVRYNKQAVMNKGDEELSASGIRFDITVYFISLPYFYTSALSFFIRHVIFFSFFLR